MENLDRLTTAGVPVYDLNTENLERQDWSVTPLGPRDKWPLALQVLVNSCLLPNPLCAALYWGDELCVIHNLAWAKATKSEYGQGARAGESCSHEALSALKSAVRGRTVKVDTNCFLQHVPEYGDASNILLTTVLDEHGKRQGVLAQLLQNSATEQCLPLSGLSDLTDDNEATQTKPSQAQQRSNPKADSHQTQLFRTFAEIVPNGLAILDMNAEAVFVNDNFFKLTTNKSAKGFRAWPESIHPNDFDRVISMYRNAFKSRDELRVEFRCACDNAGEDQGEDGEWRLFLLRPLSEDSEAGYICAVVDITEIKQAQLSQEKAATDARDRKEQQERFIDMISHEIRNPLSAVLHLAEEIKSTARTVQEHHGSLKESMADFVDAADTILLCVSHQNTLVDDILSFSKLDSMMLSLVPRQVQPKWEFARALKVFNSEFRAKKIKFHYAMDVSYDEQQIDTVLADTNRMTQVLVNLITNAIKFTAKKDGERNITVSLGVSQVRPTSYPPNVVFFSPDAKAFHIDSTMGMDWGGGATAWLMVAVRDTGIGITAENQRKLFERFRQATPKTQETYGGSGLGLFISRKLCQLHGGDIGVSSKEGVGSTFGFFFKVRHVESTSSDGRPSLGKRNTSRSSRSVMQSRSPSDYNFPHPSADMAIRPKPTTLTSHEGVNADEVKDDRTNDSLENPPTEHHIESHDRAATPDERFSETQKIAEKVEDKHQLITVKNGPAADLRTGETQRQGDAATKISQAQSKETADTRPTLLLVEDNLINQKVLRRQLQSRGFEVFVANNGQEAIDAVEERGRKATDTADFHNYFDCILMDQEMPIKDGNAATVEIRQLQEQGKAGKSPILGVSANVRDAQTDAMRKAGMDDIIGKPFKVDKLVEMIRSLISSR